MRTLTLRKAALAAALPLALSSLAACGNSSSQVTANDPQAGPTSSPTAKTSTKPAPTLGISPTTTKSLTANPSYRSSC